MTDLTEAPTTEPTVTEGPSEAPNLSRPDEQLYSTPDEPVTPTEPDEQEDPEGESEEQASPEGGGTETDSGETEDEGITPSSMSELAEYLETDADWLSSLKVDVKVDGEPGHASVKELVASYQMREAAEKRLEDAKTKANEVTAELTQKRTELDSQFQVAAELIKGAEKLLDAETANVDWAKLREDDPAEYAALRDETRERRQEIDRMKAQAVSSYQTLTEEQQAEAAEQFKARKAQEHTKLLDAIPDWKKEGVEEAERTEIVSHAQSLGFSPEEIGSVIDHRLIVMLRNSHLYEKGKAKLNAAKKKKSVTVPKVMKPGPRTDESKPRPTDPAEILYG